MLILLSPTKQMNFNRIDKYENSLKTPSFLNEAKSLNRELNKMDCPALIRLMKISDKIADSAHLDIKSFNSEAGEFLSALYAYSGTVFQWIKPESLGEDELKYAAEHLRILSGLYGVLHPDDRIFRYRLEMKTPLSIGNCNNLYQFWKKKLTDYLIGEDQAIINLASNEYIKAINTKQLKHPFISIQFKEQSGNQIRTVGMYSKMARGLMAGKILREQLSDPFLIKGWNLDGYIYNAEQSGESDWIFIKKRD